MIQETRVDAVGMRKTIRPVLIASKETVTEHTTFLRRLLVGLAGESISTVLLAPPGCDVEPIVPAPVTVLTHPVVDMPFTEHFGIGWLAGRLEKCKPTVLHSLSEARMGLTRRLAREMNLPYVQTINSLARRFRRLSVSPDRCQAIAVPSETVRLGVSRACVRCADRVRQIRMGTFVNEPPVCFSDSSRLPSLVIAAPLDQVSDFEHVFKAIKALLTDGYEFVVVVMGTGAAEHSLRRFLAEQDLTQAVTLVPVLNPWRSVLAAADVFVQPQPLTGFSSFLLEAMSLGTAVAACLGGVDDLIIPNQTAVVFEPDDESSIRAALAQLLDRHDFARRLARTAQEHVKASYSVSKMISDTLATYAEAQRCYQS
jgi:glycosyltransferase involved in cell wall biosynthesis